MSSSAQCVTGTVDNVRLNVNCNVSRDNSQARELRQEARILLVQVWGIVERVLHAVTSQSRSAISFITRSRAEDLTSEARAHSGGDVGKDVTFEQAAATTLDKMPGVIGEDVVHRMEERVAGDRWGPAGSHVHVAVYCCR